MLIRHAFFSPPVLCAGETCVHAGRWNRPTVTREMEKKRRLRLRLMVLMHKYEISACSPAASCHCCKMSSFLRKKKDQAC